jgi:hypothetical protein
MIYYVKGFGIRQGQTKRFMQWLQEFDFSELPPGVQWHGCFLSWGDTAPFDAEVWFTIDSWEMCDFLKESSAMSRFLTEWSRFVDKAQPFRSWFFTTVEQGVVRESDW